MTLQIHDRAKAAFPDRFLVEELLRNPFAAENLGMNSDDEHFLVVGPVEDADLPSLRKGDRRPPKEIVTQFRGARMLETEYLATLGIDSGHHVLDGPILSRGIHGLEDQEQGISVGGVEQGLQGTEVFNVILENVFIFLLGPVGRRDQGGQMPETNPFPRSHLEILGIVFHYDLGVVGSQVHRRNPELVPTLFFECRASPISKMRSLTSTEGPKARITAPCL